MTRGWQPIISGEDARRFAAVVDSIGTNIAAAPSSKVDVGPALVHTYVARVTGDKDHARAARACVDREVDRLESGVMPDYLYGGIAGTAWLVAHTDTLLGQADAHALEDVDALLLATCVGRRPRIYDLISGWAGVAVYFLERLPHENAREGLRRILTILATSAEHDENGWRWPTPRSMLGNAPRARSVAPSYNLGIAHGIPGITAVAADILRTGETVPDAVLIARQSAQWVLQHRLPSGGFPGWSNSDERPEPARLAWCYGELGIATALLAAGRALKDSAIEAAALDIALESTKRRTETGIRDAGLCHGAAGNGHLYNRLYQATRHTAFLDAAQYWLHCALDMRVPNEGIGGYRTWRSHQHRPTTEPWQPDGSFLTGAPGTALAFLAAISDVEPNWDRLLLTRIDPI